MSLPLLIGVSEVTAWITLVMVIVGAALKLWAQLTENKATKAKLEKAQEVVGAVGEAINDVTPLLGADKAKILKANVRDHAGRRNVASELDELVTKYKLNEKPTAEIANPLE